MTYENKSSAELEREVEAQRNRVEARLGEIKDRLSPGQLLDEALSYTKHGGAHFASAPMRATSLSSALWPRMKYAIAPTKSAGIAMRGYNHFGVPGAGSALAASASIVRLRALDAGAITTVLADPSSGFDASIAGNVGSLTGS